MRNHLLPLTLAAAMALASGQAFAQAGLLTGGATKLEPIKLSSGQPLTAAPYELESGKYYEIEIEADGSAEIALTGPSFFRNVWIDEIVVNDLEIRPLGVDSLEFDDEGVMEISFVTIRPGTFVLQVPNTTSDSQKAVFNVK
ncbi:MAG: hypothetical protein HC871_09430 [Rhizobiales bacterium]|nr:hypothetical protein [Hyphomicrobiales bacterium]